MTISSVAASRPLSALQPPLGASTKKADLQQRSSDAVTQKAPDKAAELFGRKKIELEQGAKPEVLGKYRASEAQQSPNAQEPRIYDEADRKALLASWGASAGDERFSADYDLNSDGRINSSDLAALLGSFKPTGAGGASGEGDGSTPAALSLEGLRAAWGSRLGESNFNPDYDFNNDGLIDSKDLAEYLGNQSNPADADDTGSDLTALLGAFGSRQGEDGYDPSYDHDGDGRVSSSDLAHFLGDRGAQAADALRQNQLQRLLESFGSASGDQGFEGAFDFDGDGRISSADLADFLGRSA